jgi:hypothetical protein
MQTDAIQAVLKHEQLVNAGPSSEINIYRYKEKKDDF